MGVAGPRLTLRPMFFLDVETLTHAPQADHEVGEEVAPGVVIERRTILKLGLLGLAALALPPLAGCQTAAPVAAPPLTLDQMLALLRPRAKALIQAPLPDEEAYLRQVAGLMLRLIPPPNAAAPGTAPVAFSALLDERPLVIYQIKMAPGASIPLHDHRHYNGVLMGLEGACRCRYFDIAPPAGAPRWETADGQPPIGADFLLKPTMDCQLKPGTTGQLSRVKNNIHELVAGPDGARMLDVFTFFRQDGTSHWLEKRADKLDRNGNLAARWW